MNRWVLAAAVLCGLAAAGCEGQYEVRGFVYGVDVEQGFVEVAKDEEPAPTDAVPLENAFVMLQVYKITGELADEFPPAEGYTSAQGEFRFELPESLVDCGLGAGEHPNSPCLPLSTRSALCKVLHRSLLRVLKLTHHTHRQVGQEVLELARQTTGLGDVLSDSL